MRTSTFDRDSGFNLSDRRNEIPSVFCWTKMGTEAGQSLAAILRRKELERRSGDGLFAWGIGNSLGNAPALARTLSPNGEVEVLFTPMKSAPKAIDVTPTQLLLWTAYVRSDGRVTDLPDHILVTSRGGAEKRSHYALMCHSEDEIGDTSSDYFDASHAKNLASKNPIGASQVTSVVSYDGAENVTLEKPYRIAFRAKLHAEGFVRLVNPIVMNINLIQLYRVTCEADTPVKWMEGAQSIRAEARSTLRNTLREDDLFAALA